MPMAPIEMKTTATIIIQLAVNRSILRWLELSAHNGAGTGLAGKTKGKYSVSFPVTVTNM